MHELKRSARKSSVPNCQPRLSCEQFWRRAPVLVRSTVDQLYRLRSSSRCFPCTVAEPADGRYPAQLRLCVIFWAIFLAYASAGQGKDEPASLVTSKNPDPARLPTLGVRESKEFGAQPLTMVWASFPNVPDFRCESWCYESEMDFAGARALEGGKLELRHSIRNMPATLVTRVTPEPGAVEFVATVEVDKSKDPGAKLPDTLPAPNMCWQLRKAPAFASAPQSYPEFVKRCFIFTSKGRTFLDQTVRRKIPVRSAEDRYNNPP